MIRILHIAPDEKFIDSARWQFEQIYPNSNKFIIIVPDIKNHKFRFIKNSKGLELLNDSENSLKLILDQMSGYDLVMIHSLDLFRSKLVIRSDKSVKFIWFFWGYELYHNKRYFKNKIYGDLTKRIFIKNRSIKSFLVKQYYNLKNHRVYNSNIFEKAIKRINYFSSFIPEEYEMIKRLNIISAQYFRFSYYPIEFIIKDYLDDYILGNNIIIGNSAYPNNNHLEAFKILKKLNIDGKKIIVPLSYGKIDYASKIIDEGNKTFGKQFEPLTDFLPIEKYNDVLKKCNVLIVNHYRQQAEGAIFAMLWIGAKVYLDERNVIYHYLRRIGCKIFSISKDLNPNNTDALNSLDPLDIKRNRDILIREMGSENLLLNLKDQIVNLIKN